jgi:hypothetical protein
MEVLSKAVIENWNRESDWWWLTTQVNTKEQLHYCLERILTINPSSLLAIRMIKRLNYEQATKTQVITVIQQSFA